MLCIVPFLHVFEAIIIDVTSVSRFGDISFYRMPAYKTYSCQKVKFSRCRPGVAQRVGRATTLLFHDRGTRRGWVVRSTPRPNFTPEKDPVPIIQEAGWAPEPVWTGGKSRPHRDSIPDHPARSQSLYRLNYRVHYNLIYNDEKRSQKSMKECDRLSRNVDNYQSVLFNIA